MSPIFGVNFGNVKNVKNIQNREKILCDFELVLFLRFKYSTGKNLKNNLFNFIIFE